MKIAVYTVSKNEEKFVERWYQSALEADCLVLVDTGSNDNTVKLARSLRITTHSISVQPWRFDDARNAAVALLPADIDVCVSVDVDEVLSAGWRQALEAQWGSANRGRYLYTWSHNEDGSPGLAFWYEKIHSRHGFRWKHPVHEILVPDRTEERWVNVEGMEVHHWPDPAKSRSSYLPLLALSVAEDPSNDRNAYYYARELRFYGHSEESAREYKRHLSLSSARWPPERAASCRGLALLEPENAEKWLKQAICESPATREARVELARLYYKRSQWLECLGAAEGALAITERSFDYLSESWAWGSEPHDLAAIAAYHLGRYDEALRCGLRAVELEPTDKRLIANIEWYRSGVSLPGPLGTFVEEDPAVHWAGVEARGVVLDLGAGDFGRCGHLPYPPTAEHWLDQGASQVVAVDANASDLEHYADNPAILTMATTIDGPEAIQLLIEQFRPSLVKVDIEGAEEHLLGVSADVLLIPNAYAIEAHSADLYRSLRTRLEEHGYVARWAMQHEVERRVFVTYLVRGELG